MGNSSPEKPLNEKSPFKLEEFIDKEKNRIFRLCYGILGRREDAEDAAQETFLRTVRSAAKIQPEKNVGGWLTRIAVNVCRDTLSRRSREKAAFEEYAVEARHLNKDLAAYSAPDLTLEDVEQAILELPPSCREAVILKFTQNMRYSEIAETLGISLSGVKMRILRAKELIAEGISARRGRERE